jgi:hypothetical protein
VRRARHQGQILFKVVTTHPLKQPGKPRIAHAAVLCHFAQGHRTPFQRIAAIYLLLDALVTAGEPQEREESSLREESMIKKGIDYINLHYDRPLTLSDITQ